MDPSLRICWLTNSVARSIPAEEQRAELEIHTLLRVRLEFIGVSRGLIKQCHELSLLAPIDGFGLRHENAIDLARRRGGLRGRDPMKVSFSSSTVDVLPPARESLGRA